MSRRIGFRVTAGGEDVTSQLEQLGVSITITDAIGTESDRAEIEFDDLGGQIDSVETGVELLIWLGYVPGLDFMGRYIVDEVRYEGWPQKVIVLARAADQRESLKERRVEAYEDMTLGDIFQEVAGRNGLQAAVSGQIASFLYPYIAQQEESDEEFASRLAGKHGAIATVKNGRLIVVPKGSGENPDGQSMGTFQVRRPGNLVSYSVTWKDKPAHETVEASWFNRDEAELETVEEEASDHGPTYRIREPFPTEEEAQEAARSKAVDIRRGEASATFEIEGDTDARAEMFLQCSGVRSKVDGLWSIERVEHRVDGTFTTTITAKPPEVEGGTSGSPPAEAESGGLNWTAPDW